MKKKTIKVSKKGKNWKGWTLNANCLDSGVVVYWKGKLYTTGNRQNRLVELYYNGDFRANVDAKNIRLVK